MMRTTRSVAVTAVLLVGAACGADLDADLATVDSVNQDGADPESTADGDVGSHDSSSTTRPHADDDPSTSQLAPTSTMGEEPAPPPTRGSTSETVPDRSGTTAPSGPVSSSPGAGSDDPDAPAGSGFPLDVTSTLVVGAIDDLAERLAVDRDLITVVEARAVTWGDSSLGCPQPGMRYLQRLVDGSEVVLAAIGSTYRYTGGSPLTLCEQPLQTSKDTRPKLSIP